GRGLGCGQGGNATTAALLSLHTLLYEPPSLVLMLSPSLRQSSELFRSLMQFYRLLEGAPELAAESALRAEFRNGSRGISLPGTERAVRGNSAASLVVIAEASTVLATRLTPVHTAVARADGPPH